MPFRLALDESQVLHTEVLEINNKCGFRKQACRQMCWLQFCHEHQAFITPLSPYITYDIQPHQGLCRLTSINV